MVIISGQLSWLVYWNVDSLPLDKTISTDL